MIVLDTNVLSELTRGRPDAAVMAWLDAVPSNDVATTAITLAELLYGVARLPRGRRRSDLGAAIAALVDEDLGGRVLPFGAENAAPYAEVVSDRERLGRPISVVDAQIAAICREHSATLVTRNARDFEHTGVDVLDPWVPAHPEV